MQVRDLARSIDSLFSRSFARLVVLVLFFTFLASLFAWPQLIYEQIPIFNKPELRILVEGEGSEATLSNEFLMQRTVTVKNRGHKPAEDLYLNLFASPGRITRIEVFSDYPYEVEPIKEAEQGQARIFLKSLVPGAQIIVFVWAVRPVNAGPPVLLASSVNNVELAKAWTSKSGLEEVQEFGEQTQLAFIATLNLFQNGRPDSPIENRNPSEFVELLRTIPYDTD